MASRIALTVPALARLSQRSWVVRASASPDKLLWRRPTSARTFTSTTPALAKRYTREHEWIELDDPPASGASADGVRTAMVGISTYAAKSLHDVVYVELPEVDLEFGQGDAIGAVESVKAASDINAPVACKVLATNALLEEKPGTINKGPEDSGSAGGWLAKVEVKEAEVQKELDALMSPDEYKKFTEEA